MAELVGVAIFFFGGITVYAFMHDNRIRIDDPTEHGGRPL
jgi:hypothetical protein